MREIKIGDRFEIQPSAPMVLGSRTRVFGAFEVVSPHVPSFVEDPTFWCQGEFGLEFPFKSSQINEYLRMPNG